MPRSGVLRRAGRASVVLGFLWTGSWPQAALAQDLVITNARILDGTGRVIDRGSVVITAGRIASVSAGTVAAPRGARVIDAQGRVVAWNEPFVRLSGWDPVKHAPPTRDQLLSGRMPAMRALLEPLKLDGKTHKLQVKIRKPRMKVRARKHYVASAEKSTE